MFDSFYEINSVKHYPIYWFVNKDNVLHYFAKEKTKVVINEIETMMYDGEVHFSEGTVNELILDGENYLLSYKEEPDQFYQLKSADRISGELTFFHWRHGISTYIGLSDEQISL